jgi:ankyrin repeat protein
MSGASPPEHPRFDDAVACVDAGDLDALGALLAAEPALVHARTNLDPPHHYFSGAMLLHHVAGNPDRGRLSDEKPAMPANTPAIARLLLDAGADVHARTTGPNGGTTMGLLITSKSASDAGQSGPLIDVLLEYGAHLSVTGPNDLDGPLANHAPRAAERMIELGARVDVIAAAALGRMETLRAQFGPDGRLLDVPTGRTRVRDARDAIGLALLFAYVNRRLEGRREAVDFLLEKDGNWNMIGVNNGTALHRAAWDGDLDMVERLVARGADAANRQNPFTATPFSWADHNGQAAIVAWMRARRALDLHDAVCFDLPEIVDAHLRDDPASVNRRLDQWELAQGTPLHWAAWLGRDAIASRLVEAGADPNVPAGDGRTALDLVDAAKAPALHALLVGQGARRSDE